MGKENDCSSKIILTKEQTKAGAAYLPTEEPQTKEVLKSMGVRGLKALGASVRRKNLSSDHKIVSEPNILST